MSIDALIHPEWIITMDPQNRVLKDHSIAIGNGRIQALLPEPETRKLEVHRHTFLPGHAMIPGLVNAHTHAAMTLLRGLADDLPLMTWLNEHIWPKEARWMGEDFVHDGTQLALIEMLRSGITCFNDMYFFPDVTARAVAAAGLRACIGLIVIDHPSAWADGPDEYLSKGLALHDQYRDHPLIRTAFAPHAPYSVADAPLRRVATLAEELDIPIHMHVQETADEVAGSLREHGRRPLARLHDLGLVSPRLLAVHLTQTEPAEIELLAREGAHVVHCPESNLKLASGTCPITDLLAAGVNCTLGTDGAASNNDLNLVGEMRTAALLAKGSTGQAAALPAQEVLRMATINGARALGLEAEIGSLEVGKSADMVAVNLNKPETQPLYDPVSQLVYACSREQIRHAWVAGRCLMWQREVTDPDTAEALSRAKYWARLMRLP